jgi:Flp pilus assembly protein TadD
VLEIVVMAFLPLALRTLTYLIMCRIRAVNITLLNAIVVAGAGRTNMLIGRYDLAVEYLSQLVELQPERAEVHNSLGEACRAAGDSTEARREFEEAILLDSAYTLPLRNLGSLLIKQGNEAEGFDFYIRAARLGDGPASDFLRLRGIKWN